jgi:hypothetical protein
VKKALYRPTASPIAVRPFAPVLLAVHDCHVDVPGFPKEDALEVVFVPSVFMIISHGAPIVLFKKFVNRIVPDAGIDVPSVNNVPRNSVNPCGNVLSADTDIALKLIGYADII